MKITPLKMWVQNVLPVVYDDSLSYYEMVGKINEKTNEIITQVNENTEGIEALNEVIQQLGDIDELKELLEEVETIVENLYTTDTPAMDSANGSAGVANHAARSDHVHPSDSSKANINSPAFTGTPTAPTPTAGDNTGNIATTAFITNFMRCLAVVNNEDSANREYVYGDFLIHNGGIYYANTTISINESLEGKITPIITGGLNALLRRMVYQNITATVNAAGVALFGRDNDYMLSCTCDGYICLPYRSATYGNGVVVMDLNLNKITSTELTFKTFWYVI